MPPKRKAPARKTKAAIAAESVTASAVAAAAKSSGKASKVDSTEIIETISSTTETTVIITEAVSTEAVEEEQQEQQQEQQVEAQKKPKRNSKAKKNASAEMENVEITAPVSKPANQDQEMNQAETSSETTKAGDAPLTMAERMEKLKGLRQKLNASKQANRTDLMAEHQKSKVNRKEEHKKERAREEAEKLMAKRDAEEAGEDYERSQFWGYSAESVERWSEKQEAKRIRMDNKFTDWDQVNHKKYLKQVGELKPNLAAYNAKKEAAMHTNEDGELVVSSDSGFYRDANSVAFLSDAKPNALAVDRLAADVAKQIDARSRFSKRRAHKEDEDVNYINDANQRFNQKIARFYDKHTKEIRDDFERGTALTYRHSAGTAGHEMSIMDGLQIKKEEESVPSVKTEPVPEDAIRQPSTKSQNENEQSDSDDDEEDVFEVEKVVGHKRDPENGLYYYIRWKGYKDSDNTWEPEGSVFCYGLIKEYWTRYQQAGGKMTDESGLDPKPGAPKRKSSQGHAKTLSTGGTRRVSSQEPLLPDLSTVISHASTPSAINASSELKSHSREESRELGPSKRQRRFSQSSSIDTVGAGADSGQSWRPPITWDSWEDRVELVVAIERRSAQAGSDQPTLAVHLRWTNGKETEHTTSEVRRRCPQKLLDYYESNLRFMQGPEVGALPSSHSRAV
ncbi:hypothetical protein BGZ72_009275 [Mortierella alpina]|nr:hypothetical protein BGZ72_009275 [Mortierella alpina]